MEGEFWVSGRNFEGLWKRREGRGGMTDCEEEKGEQGRDVGGGIGRGGVESCEECSSPGRNLGRVKNP